MITFLIAMLVFAGGFHISHFLSSGKDHELRIAAKNISYWRKTPEEIAPLLYREQKAQLDAQRTKERAAEEARLRKQHHAQAAAKAQAKHEAQLKADYRIQLEAEHKNTLRFYADYAEAPVGTLLYSASQTEQEAAAATVITAENPNDPLYVAPLNKTDAGTWVAMGWDNTYTDAQLAGIYRKVTFRPDL